MKNLKKIFAGMLMVAMAVSVLAGCMSDPVADDFENFLNVGMQPINAKYEEMKTLIADWDSFEEDAEYVECIKKCIANIDEQSTMLMAIPVETEEVKAVRDKYKTMLDTYKAAYESMDKAFAEIDEKLLEEGGKKLEEAVELSEVYNKGLEDLADRLGMTIEY